MTDFQVAGVIRYLMHQTLDESGFAFAVLAYKRHFLSSANGEGHVVEYGMLTVVFSYFLADNGKIAASRCRRKTKMKTRHVFFVNLQTL